MNTTPSIHAPPASSTDEHPPLDQLADYTAGALDDTTADAVAEHLTSCAACSEIVLDLDALSGPAEAIDAAEAASMNELAHQRAWRALDAAVGDGEHARATARAPAWRALAAALAVAVVALGLWSASLHQANVALRARAADDVAARPDLPVLYLDLVRSDGPVLYAAADQDFVLLIIDPTADAEAYRVALLRSGGDGSGGDGSGGDGSGGDGSGSDPLWSGTLTRSAEGGLRLGLPTPPPGGYHLRVEGRVDGSWSELVTYTLRVETDQANQATGAG